MIIGQDNFFNYSQSVPESYENKRYKYLSAILLKQKILEALLIPKNNIETHGIIHNP